LTGVFVAILAVFAPSFMSALNFEHGVTGVLGDNGYQIVGVLAFIGMMTILYRTAIRK
jgi:hypothetical protein